MKKINSNELAEETWSSPKGKFAGAGKEISEALGRIPRSTDLIERHPCDVEMISPDSQKWGVRSPEPRVFRGEALDYFDREE